MFCLANHDDDVLWFQLHKSGQLLDDYDSAPGYFDPEAEEIVGPEGGDAQVLCNAFGVSSVEEVSRVLHGTSDKENYVFQYERHQELAKALGLRVICSGYRYLNEGTTNGDISLDELVRAGARDA